MTATTTRRRATPRAASSRTTVWTRVARSCVSLACLLTLSWDRRAAWAWSVGGPTTASVVTGANGYVGREIVHELLRTSTQRESGGHDVVCLVRAGRVAQEEAYWRSYQDDDDAGCRVRVAPYDMLDGGASILDALDDTCGDTVVLYHVASTFGPTEEHVRTALDNVQGTENVLRALRIFKHGTTQDCRLILTSSMAAVRAPGQEPQYHPTRYTHRDWNEEAALDVNWGQSYQWSKARSERVAWQRAGEWRIPMTALCPSFVFGPVGGAESSVSSSYSIELVQQWARGEQPVRSRLCVDVRDVAAAHVAAGFAATTGERYLLSAESRLTSAKVAEVLRSVMGDTDNINSDAAYDESASTVVQVGEPEVEAAEKLRAELGIVCRPVQETMADMVKSLLPSLTKKKNIALKPSNVE